MPPGRSAVRGNQDLPDIHPAGAEGKLAVGEVEFPQPLEALVARMAVAARHGRDVRVGSELAETLRQLDPGLRERVAVAIALAPGWLRWDSVLFVHGGFHTAMLESEPSPAPEGPVRGPLARALYGEPTGRIQPDGYPERSIRWVDRIPAGLTVYCGHDQRSRDGRPYVRTGAAGGKAVFLDTGAGKGGHLSWIDLPARSV